MEGGVAELWVYQIQYNRWGDAEVDIYSISQQLCSEETTAFELLTLLFGRVTGTLAGEPLPEGRFLKLSSIFEIFILILMTLRELGSIWGCILL